VHGSEPTETAPNPGAPPSIRSPGVGSAAGTLSSAARKRPRFPRADICSASAAAMTRSTGTCCRTAISRDGAVVLLDGIDDSVGAPWGVEMRENIE